MEERGSVGKRGKSEGQSACIGVHEPRGLDYGERGLLTSDLWLVLAKMAPGGLCSTGRYVEGTHPQRRKLTFVTTIQLDVDVAVCPLLRRNICTVGLC